MEMRPWERVGALGADFIFRSRILIECYGGENHRFFNQGAMMGGRKLLCTAVAIAMCVIAFRVPVAQAGSEWEHVRKLADQVLVIMRQTDLGTSEREKRFDRVFSNAFDMRSIARFALGLSWRVATKKQRSDYLTLFSKYFVQSHSARLGVFSSESLVFFSEQKLRNKIDMFVSTRIIRPGKTPIATVWRVRNTKDQLKIIDLMVEGMSMSVTYRESFAAVIGRGGVSGLLDALRAKTEKRLLIEAKK
jgi:phospholipid transport system substrate-binding protein